MSMNSCILKEIADIVGDETSLYGESIRAIRALIAAGLEQDAKSSHSTFFGIWHDIEHVWMREHSQMTKPKLMYFPSRGVAVAEMCGLSPASGWRVAEIGDDGLPVEEGKHER